MHASEESDEVALLTRAETGDGAAVGALLDRHRDRLERMVRLRLDPMLKGRVDPADVVQDSYLQAARRLPEYLRDRSMPFSLWLRFLTQQRLLGLHREHLGTQARDPRRELDFGEGFGLRSTVSALAAVLVAHQTSPSGAAIREEERLRIERALETMNPIDREIIVLRHFEQLTPVEAALELGIERAAASQRYVRALRRIKSILDDVADGNPGP